MEEVSDTVAKEKKEEEKPNHPGITELENRSGDHQSEEDEQDFYEPCHHPYDGHRDTYGYRRYTPRYGYNNSGYRGHHRGYWRPRYGYNGY